MASMAGKIGSIDFYRFEVFFISATTTLFKGSCKMSDYCSSKFAAVGLHESLVEELRASRKSGIKTTLICPSVVNTGLFEGLEIK